MNEVKTESVLELCFDQLRYTAIVVHHGGGDFLSIAGSKKGSRYQGGGIRVSDLNKLGEMTRLIGRISDLKQSKDAKEARVDFFDDRGWLVTGETRCFEGRWFYRIKAYTNFFADKEAGELHYFKNHELRPSGRGFYIKEFDFSISTSGIDLAMAFSKKLEKSVEDYLCGRIGQTEDDSHRLIRNGQMLVGGAPLWVNSDLTLERVTLHKPLFNILCEKLRVEPLTPNRLAIRLGLTSESGDRQLNPSSRYDPRFLEQGYVVDRVRRGFDSVNYLITQIPKESLDESPSLAYLFKGHPPGKWPDWISATFSNDDYSNGRNSSLHFAEFEIGAFEGGFEWGIIPALRQLRVTAVRLFDLKRHFESDKYITMSVAALIQRFVSVTEEAGFD